MTAVGGNPLEVTDRDVDTLTWQFLNSDHPDGRADGPLNRRLDGFLRHRGLARLADIGDIFDRVMTYISVLPRQNGQPDVVAMRSPT